MLPPDCSLREVASVDPEFSARFSALERTYVYIILATPSRSALIGQWAWHVAQPLDVEGMHAAASTRSAQHDFRSFATGDGSTVRSVRRFTVRRAGDLVRIESRPMPSSIAWSARSSAPSWNAARAGAPRGHARHSGRGRSLGGRSGRPSPRGCISRG